MAGDSAGSSPLVAAPTKPPRPRAPPLPPGSPPRWRPTRPGRHHDCVRRRRSRPGHQARRRVAQDRQLLGVRHRRRLVDRPRQGRSQGRHRHRRRQTAARSSSSSRTASPTTDRASQVAGDLVTERQRRHAPRLRHPGHRQPGGRPGRSSRMPRAPQLRPVAGPVLRRRPANPRSSSGSTATCSARKRPSPPSPTRSTTVASRPTRRSGMLFQNDADYKGWMDPSAAPKVFAEKGYTLVGARSILDPGRGLHHADQQVQERGLRDHLRHQRPAVVLQLPHPEPAAGLQAQVHQLGQGPHLPAGRPILSRTRASA